MIFSSKIFLIIFTISVISEASLGSETVEAGCTVTSYNDVANAVASCTTIVINGITVPAGQTLVLALKAGTKLTFEGTIKFEYMQWSGPLVLVQGSGITVTGASGSVLDGQGPLYWAQGSITKPQFFSIQDTDNSILQNIKLLNCPTNCVSIAARDTTLSRWTIDCSAGDSTTSTSHNTGGIVISSSRNLVIDNSIVKNQGDCVTINFASDITLRGLTCSGGQGLSLSVGLSRDDPSKNVVADVLFINCTVTKSGNGIHVKTHGDGTTGIIRDITYQDILLSEIVNYGVNVQEGLGPSGTAVGNIPINNFKMTNVRGTMNGGPNSMPVYIFCATGACADWTWTGLSITGGKMSSSCNFTPTGYIC